MLRHTDRDYERELETLRERVLFMGAQVESLVHTAFVALQRRDATTAHAAIALDEEIDHLEVEIDELSLRVLARRQPVASDLRFITTTLKLVTDLERAADLGVNVAERVVELAAYRQTFDVLNTLNQMADITIGMLRDALDAFVSADAIKAEQVLDRDAAVDSLYSELFPALISQMVADIQNVEQATRIQSVGKYIERIADHATNIAEMVIFMVKGQDVRHHFNVIATGRA
ncbi:MAG TPA: phosphate signaling complex protein PhoU [Polyangiaceae bacterium]